jgi:hypothetical protein
VGRLISPQLAYMKKFRIYKCNYTFCKHNKTVNSEEAIKHNSKYYHPECLRELSNKNLIRDLFYENINKTEIGAIFTKVINRIIHELNVPSDFLLFALKYAIYYKIALKHAMGLYYLINNDKIKKAYEKRKNKNIIKEIKKEQNETQQTEEEITFTIDTENKGWEEIIKR